VKPVADAPIWITEAEVVALLSLHEAITALEPSLECEARGEAHNMVKTHVAVYGVAIRDFRAAAGGVATSDSGV
jgi:alanine dehydrogenase